MKLLFFQWNSFMNKGIERALKKMQITYHTFFYQFKDWEKDDTFLQQFEETIRAGGYRTVLSVNFAPLVSQICQKFGVHYIAWVYDSPLHIRDFGTLTNSCNTIYFFDKVQAMECRKMGADARHMPLAVDTGIFEVHPTQMQQEKYATEISIVGKLYQTEYKHYLQPLSDYQRGYLEGIINAQLKLYGGYLIPEMITEELLSDLNVSYDKASNHQVKMEQRELEFLLACETTGRERYVALALLSKYFKTDIYSLQKDERLAKASFKGYADYYKDMPFIFNLSKINLNISLKTIQTGIPLRVLDVMGCGGFVLSNYQEEIAEHFEDGRECVIYESLEDLYAKAKFYLAHESIRAQIAENGLKKVARDFTFEGCLLQMLKGE